MSKHKDLRHGKHKATHAYDRQRIRTEKNKRVRREKHLENNPNDMQSKEIIKKLFKDAKNED